MNPSAFPDLVLFDLDGTLLDSAPDFVATIDVMRAARGEPAISLPELRPYVSRGSRAMLGAGFPQFDTPTREAMIGEFLDVYEAELARHGTPFDGVELLLAAIEAAGSRWGIVTNKPEHLARLLLPRLGWQSRCAVLVGGDTLPVRKPDPLPLLHAAKLLGMDALNCVYVGDDERDIAAARSAHMPSVVALWGYRLGEDDPMAWGGDVVIETPHGLRDPAAWPKPR